MSLRVVTFKLDTYTLEKIDDLAKTKNVTRSEIIRKAIELYLRLEDYKLQAQPRYVRLLS